MRDVYDNAGLYSTKLRVMGQFGWGANDRVAMRKLAAAKMPFGKHAGMRLIDLPEPYVIWLSQKGFPKGELGEMLGIVYEIKVNGLEYLFKKIK